MSFEMNARVAALTVTLVSCALLAQGSVFAQTVGAVPEQTAERSIGTLGGVSFVAGARLWANRWEIVTVERIPTAVAPGTVVLQDKLVTNTSSLEIVPIPFVAARAGNFLASFYYFPRTSYDSGTAAIGTVDRDEYDISLGYSMLPPSDSSLIVSIGYKRAYGSKVSVQIPNSATTVEGVLLGVAGTAPLTDRLRLYGSAAYGIGRQKVDFAYADGSSNKTDVTYGVGEVGLTYLAYSGGDGDLLKNVTISLGYRTQVLTSKSIPLFTVSLPPTSTVLATEQKDFSTTTNGFVLGFVAGF